MGDKSMRNLVSFSIFIVLCLFIQVQEVQSKKTMEMIPDEAIRLRILANSDSDHDQKIKLVVRDQVSFYISELVREIDNIDEARTMIENNIPEVEKIVQQTLINEQVSDSFTVEYRKDVPFPEKMYGNYLYPEGEYEAVLITIGKGEGANWWCVLFPPLCFLEFSSKDTTEENEMDDQAMKEEVPEEEIDEELEEEIDEKEDLDAVEAEDREDTEVTENSTIDKQDEEEETKISFFLFEWFGWS